MMATVTPGFSRTAGSLRHGWASHPSRAPLAARTAFDESTKRGNEYRRRLLEQICSEQANVKIG
jgi:hypothetical protein